MEESSEHTLASVAISLLHVDYARRSSASDTLDRRRYHFRCQCLPQAPVAQWRLSRENLTVVLEDGTLAPLPFSRRRLGPVGPSDGSEAQPLQHMKQLGLRAHLYVALAGWNGALAHSLLLPSSNDMRPSCPESLAVGAYSARAMPPGFGSDGAAGSCNFVWRIAGCADTTSSDVPAPSAGGGAAPLA